MVLPIPCRVSFSVFRVVSHIPTDGNGDFDVRSAGIRKRFKENEGGVGTEGNRQEIQT